MQLVFVLIGVAVVVVVVSAVAVRRWFVPVGEHQALVISRAGGTRVAFAPTLVVPLTQRAELMDLATLKLDIELQGREGLICRDHIRADLRASFFLQVNRTAEDVLQVAKSVGARRASDPSVVRALFEAKLSDALKTVAKQMDFEALFSQREPFRDEVSKVIGQALSGYALVDLAIDHLDQTPIEALDPNNILDAQGIRKIQTVAAEQRLRVNEIAQAERKEIAHQNLAADEAMAELDRRRREMEARQKRELDALRARELGESLRVVIEEQAKVEAAMLKAKLELAEAAAKREDAIAEAEALKRQALANLDSHSVIDKYLSQLGDMRARTEAERAAVDKADSDAGGQER